MKRVIYCVYLCLFLTLPLGAPAEDAEGDISQCKLQCTETEEACYEKCTDEDCEDRCYEAAEDCIARCED